MSFIGPRKAFKGALIPYTSNSEEIAYAVSNGLNGLPFDGRCTRITRP